MGPVFGFTMTIKLHQFEMSPFCTKVALILNYKQLEYEIVETPASQSTKVKSYSPTSKLPVLEHDKRFVNDSTDIAYYLEEQFPEPAIVPKDVSARAQCHIYEDWADESLNFYMMKLRWLPQNRQHWADQLAKYDSGVAKWMISKFAPKATLNILDKQGVGRRSEQVALDDIDRHLQSVDATLANEAFLLGSELSLADISVYSQLYWMDEIPEGKAAIGKHPGIMDWMQRTAALTEKQV